MPYSQIQNEEELKNRIREDLFSQANFDSQAILGKIDFAIALRGGEERLILPFPGEGGAAGSGEGGGANSTGTVAAGSGAGGEAAGGVEASAGSGAKRSTKRPGPKLKNQAPLPSKGIYLLWAEAKRGRQNPIDSLAQLVLTIGKDRHHTSPKYHPPGWLAAIDGEKISFLRYAAISRLFHRPDLDWTVAPSDRASPAFAEVRRFISDLFYGQDGPERLRGFEFKRDEAALRHFIATALQNDFANGKRKVNLENLQEVFDEWSEEVLPSIKVFYRSDPKAKKEQFYWEDLQLGGIVGGDFFLADLISKDNESYKKDFAITLEKVKYQLKRKPGEAPEAVSFIEFRDGRKRHTAFWQNYERPPEPARLWDELHSRRDRLIPGRGGGPFLPPGSG